MEHPVWQGLKWIEIGGFQIPTYSLLMALAIIYGYNALLYFAIKEKAPTDKISGFAIFTILSALLFARLAHVFFYDWAYFNVNLLEIPMIWKGGLASHGGIIGFILGVIVYTRFWGNIWYWWSFDRISIAIPFAAAMIRLGNFANSELYGKISDCSFCMVFSNAGLLPRYPVQLMEALAYFLVGILLFALYFKKWKIDHFGLYSGLMLTAINAFRFVLEFFKDYETTALGLNMGQLLSLPFLFLGLALIFSGSKKYLNG